MLKNNATSSSACKASIAKYVPERKKTQTSLATLGTGTSPGLARDTDVPSDYGDKDILLRGTYM